MSTPDTTPDITTGTTAGTVAATTPVASDPLTSLEDYRSGVGSPVLEEAVLTVEDLSVVYEVDPPVRAGLRRRGDLP